MFYVWVAVFTGMTILAFAQTRRLARQGTEAHDAICTLRADLDRRVAASDRFLKEHPKGIPGVPLRSILESLRNQRQTLAALSGLTCESSAVVKKSTR